MLWIILLASVLGFWAVVPLATSAFSPALALPSQPAIWGNLSSLLLVLMGIFWLLPLCYHFYQRYFSNKSSPVLPLSSHSQKLRWLYPTFIFMLSLLASSSYGLYQFYQYQSQLLTTPITVKATIRSLKVSDNLSASFVVENSTQNTDDSPLTIGNGFQRQLWQIEQVQPFTGNAPADDESDEPADTQISEAQNSAKTLPNFTLPMPVLVTANTVKNPDWQITLNALQPNQTATVTLALQPIEQPQNSHLPNDNSRIQRLNLGFEEASWLRQRGILAKAQLVELGNINETSANSLHFLQKFSLSVEQLRWQFRQKILLAIQHNLYPDGKQFAPQNTDTLNANAILLGLLTGDSGLISSELKHSYQVTGISHLLAISGPHVMMLASMVAFVVLLLIKRFLPRILLRIPARLLLLWVSVAVSLLYAMFVGFELPAQRTFWMLCVVTLAMQLLLPVSGYRVLAMVGLLMMWLDTTAVGQAGFWLSFVAVALLIKFSQAFEPAVSYDTPDDNLLVRLKDTAWHGFKELLLLQLWLFVLMMPVVVWFFGKISVLSVVINLFAVPFLGLVIVPLDMLAGLLSLVPVVGDWLSAGLWKMLARVLTFFHHVIDYLIAHGWARQSYWAFSPAQMLLFALAGVPWLLDFQPLRAWRYSGVMLPKWLSLPPLLAVIALAVVKPAELSENNNLPASRSVNKLIVLDDTRLSVVLFINDNQAWLLLADNHYNADTALPILANNLSENPTDMSEEPKSRKKRSRSFPITPLSDRTMTEMLDNKIYPLLTHFGITQLTGVVSQTPSQPVNHLVQQLANNIRIQRYWLAGFDPLQPLDNQWYANLTPNPCDKLDTSESHTAKIESILLTASTANDPHSLWSQHSCAVRLELNNSAVATANPANFLPKSVIILAGDKALEPSTNLTFPPTDMLVSPVAYPLTSSTLQAFQPVLVQIISGRNSQGQLREASQFALTGWTADYEKLANTNLDNKTPARPATLQALQSSQTGSVVYRLIY